MFSSSIIADQSKTKVSNSSNSNIETLSKQFIKFDQKGFEFYLSNEAKDQLTPYQISKINEIIQQGNLKLGKPISQIKQDSNTEDHQQTGTYGEIRNCSATLTANGLYGVGDFIFSGIVGAYSVFKKLTPVGAFVWVIETSTVVANEGEEEWLKEHENDYTTEPDGSKDPDDLSKKIALITASADKVKDNIKKLGIETYSDMVKLIKRYYPGQFEAHHIIEKRFAEKLGIENTDKMRAIPVTVEQHQLFTNAWRAAIKYKTGTATTTMKEIYNKALEIYKDFPDIIDIINKAKEVQGIK
jgi:hypothetical protein